MAHLISVLDGVPVGVRGGACLRHGQRSPNGEGGPPRQFDVVLVSGTGAGRPLRPCGSLWHGGWGCVAGWLPVGASTDSPTGVSDARRPRRPRSARDPLEAAADAELAKRRRVVAVRLSEVEHLVWRGEAAADKRGQLGAWTRSVVAAEIARRHGADVPDTAPENLAGGVVVVLNESVVRELNQQLVRVGNLLNQVTRLAHIEARTGGVEAATMARVVSGIDQTRATIAALDGRLEDMSRR